MVQHMERARHGPSEQTLTLLADLFSKDLAKLCWLADTPGPDRWLSNRLSRDVLEHEYVERKRSTSEIANDLGVSPKTVADSLRRHGIRVRCHGEHPRRYHEVDAWPWAFPATGWHAYWIGFLAADGGIHSDGSHHLVRLRLHPRDVDHLHEFVRGLRVDNPVRVTAKYAQVEIHGRPLVDALTRWGVVPAKSLSIRVPLSFPPALVSAFMRGYFDGDGSISWRQRHNHRAANCKFTSGSARMLEDLQWRLEKAGIRTGAIYRDSGEAKVLPILTARADLLRFADYLYAGAEVSLARKRAIFAELGLLE